MTIKRVHLPLKPVSKPRGKLGKGGHIYHQSKEYSAYQSQFALLVKSCSFNIPDEFYGLAIRFGMKTRGGRKNDLDNMSGAVLDAMVKCGVIQDDNYGVVKHLYSTATITPHPSIEIYTCSNKKEWLYIIEKFF